MNSEKTKEQVLQDIEYKMRIVKELKQEALNTEKKPNSTGLLLAYESLMHSLEEQKKVA